MTPKKVILPAAQLSPKDHELMRLTRYLEQADAVHREAWWVVASERKVPGKTVFGKIQRALAEELKLKLPKKSLFSCDRYIVKREILSPQGYPQRGQVFENCRAKEAAVHLADFEMKTATEASLVFHGQNLGELLGLGTAILNKVIKCEMRGDTEGKLMDLVCHDFSQDRNSTESLRFTVYEYHREGKSLLKLRGQVVEALYATRKFQADVPLEGKIEVVETQTMRPEGSTTAAVPATPAIPAPTSSRSPDPNDRPPGPPASDSVQVQESGTGAPPAPGVRAGSQVSEESIPEPVQAPQSDPSQHPQDAAEVLQPTDVMPLSPEEELRQNPNSQSAPQAPVIQAPPPAPSLR